MPFQVLHFASVTSTQDIARMLLHDHLVILADEQRDGRGRMGRRWFSPPGGLWFTVVLRDPPDLLPVIAAVAVCRALEHLGYSPGIKWPNDIILDGKKLGGMIAERVGDYVLLGIGINLRNEIPHEIKDIATSVDADRDELLLAILDSLEATMGESRDEILAGWRRRSVTLGREACIRDENICGFAEDIAEDGSLILRTSRGTRRIYAGDIIQREG